MQPQLSGVHAVPSEADECVRRVVVLGDLDLVAQDAAGVAAVHGAVRDALHGAAAGVLGAAV